ncbi:lytic transglycosylase domain-containing protein [Sphaerisporangium perillae]|uniref:lytic transglycosylase domain-containing protein n=1 Tax=Sphaerisporangium perillae TaxID=2935860 RepID=UPI00200C1439|nr:lytic murein transglycosylase [Sphaerisporangium perillae]
MDQGTESTRRPARARAMAAVITATLVGVCGCGQPAGRAETASPPSPASTSERSATPAATGERAGLPAPDTKIPKDASKLARSLKDTTRALHAAVDAWTGDGDPSRGGPPEPVVLLALHQQRIYRFAARHPGPASRAFGELAAPLAGEARDNTEAIRELLSLAHPLKGSATFKVQRPLPAGVLLGQFKKAERRFGVEWEVLAAVMLVETKFGRVRSASYAGAQGPMQFMPATWKAYGMGGDIQDPEDAIAGAANYLRASGAPRDYKRALHAYNPSNAYVNAVLLHARQMKRDSRNYYAYYNWQVFVLTTNGERRLTGP